MPNDSNDSQEKLDRTATDHHRRVVAWLVFFATLGLLAKIAYRPFVLSTGVNDFGLHGVLPNFFWAAFLALFFSLRSTSPAKSCALAFAVNALYELDQIRHGGIEDTLLSSAGQTFDPWDLVAAAIGCLMAYALLTRGPGRSGRRVEPACT